MDLAAANAAAQAPGTGYGGLEPLARQALQPRVSRTETAVRLNELAGGRAGATESAARAQDGTQAFLRAPGNGTRQERPGDRPLAENPNYRMAAFRRDAQPAEPEAEGFDGQGLRAAQSELRALRADVAELARALGRPLTSQSTLTEYRGVIQQHDELDSDVQRMRFDAERELEQAADPKNEMQAALREAEARQLARKQEQLLAALRRAERRIEEAPEQVLPPGVREAVIGEILRARYSAAIFGGLGSGAQLAGRMTSTVL